MAMTFKHPRICLPLMRIFPKLQQARMCQTSVNSEEDVGYDISATQNMSVSCEYITRIAVGQDVSNPCLLWRGCWL